MDDSNQLIFNSDKDLESSRILSVWLERSGVKRKTILNEINKGDWGGHSIGIKSFQNWTSFGDSAKRISGPNMEITGKRVVAVVNWFFAEHQHRANSIINSVELQRFITIYDDIPVINQLQLHRILHDLEVELGERKIEIPVNSDWKKQFSHQTLYAYVMDNYWTIRATSKYELALSGFNEEDMKDWGFWHRLSANTRGISKFSLNSPIRSLRGCYANTYYHNQLLRFLSDTKQLFTKQDSRYLSLLNLMKSFPDFERIWSETQFNNHPEGLSTSIGYPVPFFMPDESLLWMMEFSSIISNQNNLRMVIWSPLNKETTQYLALLSQSKIMNEYSKSAFFIEEYAKYFTEEQRFALGVC